MVVNLHTPLAYGLPLSSCDSVRARGSHGRGCDRSSGGCNSRSDDNARSDGRRRRRAGRHDGRWGDDRRAGRQRRGSRGCGSRGRCSTLKTTSVEFPVRCYTTFIPNPKLPRQDKDYDDQQHYCDDGHSNLEPCGPARNFTTEPLEGFPCDPEDPCKNRNAHYGAYAYDDDLCPDRRTKKRALKPVAQPIDESAHLLFSFC